MCALVNITVLGPSMGFGYSAVALPSLRSNTTTGLHINEQQASWIGKKCNLTNKESSCFARN